jgi:hypothetical protein
MVGTGVRAVVGRHWTRKVSRSRQDWGDPMSDDEFEESSRLYETGQISRRRFMGRLVAGGASVTAAYALVSATGPAAFADQWFRRGTHYGRAPGQYGRAPGQYGRRPGQYGSPPGRYGRPPGQYGSPPGHYGRPPGQYGNPPGRYGNPPRNGDDGCQDDQRRDDDSRRGKRKSGNRRR